MTGGEPGVHPVAAAAATIAAALDDLVDVPLYGLGPEGHRGAAPLARPRPTGEDGPDPRTRGERQADAVTEICRRFLTGLPDTSNGGEPSTVVVTIREQDLRTGLGAALLPSGDAVSASTARRLACDARIIPAVLDAESTPPDLGRPRRLFTAAQRRALALRDGDGCAFPGCDRPSTWTEAHYITHWADGGPTDLANGVLLCCHHHQVIHQGAWITALGGDTPDPTSTHPPGSTPPAPPDATPAGADPAPADAGSECSRHEGGCGGEARGGATRRRGPGRARGGETRARRAEP